RSTSACHSCHGFCHDEDAPTVAPLMPNTEVPLCNPHPSAPTHAHTHTHTHPHHDTHTHTHTHLPSPGPSPDLTYHQRHRDVTSLFLESLTTPERSTLTTSLSL